MTPQASMSIQFNCLLPIQHHLFSFFSSPRWCCSFLLSSSIYTCTFLICITHYYTFLFHTFKLFTFLRIMSNRRSRGQSSSRITDDQINRLLTQLQQCLPEIRSAARSDKVPATKVLDETCKYVKKLNKDVDNLSDRLSVLLSTMDPQTEEASIIRNLMAQF